MTAPQDPNSPATAAADTAAATDSDDEVFDGELVEDGSGTLAAGVDSDDLEGISDAEISNDDATGTLAAEDKTEGGTTATDITAATDTAATDTTDAAGPAPEASREATSAESVAAAGATQVAATPAVGQGNPTPDVPAGTDSALTTPTVRVTASAYPTTTAPAFDYTDAGVPTLSYVQDKIEKRLGTAQGSTELIESSSAGQRAADQQAERERLAKAKLDEIRKSVEGH